MPDSPTLFICHTGIDQAYVELLVSRLEREDIRCWYYERDNFGQSIGAAVDQALMSCRALLFVMSKNIPQASDYVQNEIITFVNTHRTIIPLRLQQPDHWWPDGVRSLIGARPVIPDSTGSAPPDVVSEIKRRVLQAPGNRTPVLPKRRSLQKAWGLAAAFIAIAALAFFALRLPDLRNAATRKAIDAFKREDWQAGYKYATGLFADRDNPTLLHNLGLLCSNGTVVPKDDKKAVEYFRKAAERGEPCAQCSLGLMVQTGRGVDSPDPELAFSWFRKSAAQDHPEAQYRLALCYENGQGTSKNLQRAYDFYEKAAKQGHSLASQALQRPAMKNMEDAPAPPLDIDPARSKALREKQLSEAQMSTSGFSTPHDQQASQWTHESSLRGFSELMSEMSAVQYVNLQFLIQEIDDAENRLDQIDQELDAIKNSDEKSIRRATPKYG